MCHITARFLFEIILLPCDREMPAYPNRDALIDKRKYFLLSRRAIFRRRHKGLQEKKIKENHRVQSKIVGVSFSIEFRF